MRVLVTGGAGFIGSHTVDRLLRAGYDVRILDGLLPPVHAEGQPLYRAPQGVEVVRGDVRERAAWVQALHGVDVVFHLAAYQDYLPDFSTFFHTNAVSTALLYEVAVADRLVLRKVIVASSQAVYGEGRYRCHTGCVAAGPGPASNGIQFPPMREEPQLSRGEWDIRCPVCALHLEPQWTDDAIVNPHNAYALSKAAQEMIALQLGRRYGIPTVCMRYSIVQGARQSFRNAYSGILRIFAQRLLHHRPPVCYEDGRQLRDYVSVHDVTAANLLVLEDSRADFEVFNVGGDRRVSVLEYARLMAERTRIDIEPEVPGVYRVGDVRHIFSDTSKLKALGWQPLVPLEEIIDEYLEWARAQPAFQDYYAAAEARMVSVGVIRRVHSR